MAEGRDDGCNRDGDKGTVLPSPWAKKISLSQSLSQSQKSNKADWIWGLKVASKMAWFWADSAQVPQESGLYYLQSRYYDPNTGRFLNADTLVSTGQGLLGNNMFAYCRNNPVCRRDIPGTTDEECYEPNGNLLTEDDKSIEGGKMGNTGSNSIPTSVDDFLASHG